MCHLRVQLQFHLPLLSRRLGQQSNALKLLTQPGEEILHLEIGKLLAETNAWAVVEGDKFPLIRRFPGFYHLLVRTIWRGRIR